MNFEYLNEMVEYIEDNLTEEIDYKQLAKIVGISEYSLQRIFMFLTNISIAEYIRKRRLSKAFEELKTSNIKIIDLAVKYCYDNSVSGDCVLLSPACASWGMFDNYEQRGDLFKEYVRNLEE